MQLFLQAQVLISMWGCNFFYVPCAKEKLGLAAGLSLRRLFSQCGAG